MDLFEGRFPLEDLLSYPLDFVLNLVDAQNRLIEEKNKELNKNVK